jgi:tRNA threonylcarbamoyladenosine biosynthesis protein TsaB
MPLILQIETSTEICSVALSKNGQLLYSVESDDPNSHTEKLTLLIQTCMVQTGYSFKQLDAIALSDGPGSYTSLRIGAATAKGICYAMDIPLLTFNSLTILANGIDTLLIGSDDIILPMIDARRMEVYTAVYDKQLKQLEEIQPLILDTQSFTNYTQMNSVN